MLSIITPCFNEEENIAKCIDAVRTMMSANLPTMEYEHIISDNASTDDTFKIALDFARKDKRIKLLRNSRNVGPFNNIWSGLKYSSGDLIIPFLAADLQDPVAIIPKFIESMNNDVNVIYGVRTNREENLILKIGRRMFYWLLDRFSDTHLPANAGEFMLVRREVIENILETDDKYPYIRGLIAQTEPNCGFLEYKWDKRLKGKSSNNFFTLFDQALNAFISTNKLVGRALIFFGFSLATIGILFGFFSLVYFLNDKHNISPGIPTLIVGLFSLSGFQLIFLGIILEYLMSINSQVRPRPVMTIKEKVNFD